MKSYLFAACFIASQAIAAMNGSVSVMDDAGNRVVLQKPAQRIVSLAPHITELLFAAGGGERIVGVVKYSDYPAAARQIPQIGDANHIDIERLLMLKPDLLVVWQHGNSERQLAPLRQLGIPLFYSEPRKLGEIGDSVLRLGKLMDTNKQAQKSAAQLELALKKLTEKYKNRPPIKVFYQIWHDPLYTLNGQHIVNDAMRLCGGENVFSKLNVIAPSVSIESVLLANPEVIFATGSKQQSSQQSVFWQFWRQYPALLAVRYANLLTLEGDLLSRPGPRMIDGASQLCEKLEIARKHRLAQHF